MEAKEFMDMLYMFIFFYVLSKCQQLRDFLG